MIELVTALRLGENRAAAAIVDELMQDPEDYPAHEMCVKFTLILDVKFPPAIAHTSSGATGATSGSVWFHAYCFSTFAAICSDQSISTEQLARYA
jgi:hypothetical protein